MCDRNPFLSSLALPCRLFTLLMNAVRLDAEAGEVERSCLLDVILQLSLLLETFVLSSCPHFTPDTGTNLSQCHLYCIQQQHFT